MIKKIWNDPVFSQVIATGITAIISIITYNVFSSLFSSILFTIALTPMILVIYIITLILLEKYYKEKNWSDRYYELIKVTVKYDLNQNKNTLRAIFVGERKIKCISGEISHLDPTITPTENLIEFKEPTADETPKIQSFSRDDKSKNVIIYPPHRCKETFAFRIGFKPKLIKNEEAFVKYKFTLADYRFANIEHMRHEMQKSKIEARDYEFNSFTIDFPTKVFEYIIEFSPRCCVNSIDVDVKRKNSTFIKEINYIQKKSEIIRYEKDIDGCFRFYFKRENPPIRAKYMFKWIPPTIKLLDDK